jgi:predicted Zn-dependent peptidase
MAEILQKEILPRVSLTAVHTSKFKSSYMSLQFLAPLREETASLNALVPMVLRRGTERCPDMQALSAALDELYGGTVEPAIRKKGSSQCVGFAASFLDDVYAPDGSAILDAAADLLGELLLSPATDGQGGFLPAYVEGERANLVDRIRAQINDKRQYAAQRLNQLMCREPDRLGDESHAAAITGETLWERYQALFGCPIQVYYAGSAPFERVEAAFRRALSGLGAHFAAAVSPAVIVPLPEAATQSHEEAMDVTQGKLGLGFRCGVRLIDPDYPAMHILNALFGGTTTSKLFLNVREKLSLCYYASSQYDKFRGLLLVSSGVEFDKRREAQEEILTQLENCRRGSIEPWELEAAKRSAVSATLTMLDSQSRMEDFWLGQAVMAGSGPEELAARYEGVTMEQVVAAAQKVTLHTVYFLKGKEENTHGH